MGNGRSKEHTKTMRIILTALMIAIIFVVASFIKIPTMNGFIQFGTCMVFVSGVLLGNRNGFLAAGIGMGLVDLAAGYVYWAPFSFVIQGLTALTVAIIVSKKRSMGIYIIAFIAGSIVNLAGYFIANALVGGLITGASVGFIGSIIYAMQHFVGDLTGIIPSFIIAIPLAPIANNARRRFF